MVVVVVVVMMMMMMMMMKIVKILTKIDVGNNDGDDIVS